MLLGFWEDYKHVMINARHELILIRARSDNNCIVGEIPQCNCYAVTEPKENWIIQDTVANASRYVKWSR